MNLISQQNQMEVRTMVLQLDYPDSYVQWHRVIAQIITAFQYARMILLFVGPHCGWLLPLQRLQLPLL